ncbi:DUF2851 family protein [Reichenbachiella ulvae]|uniref:DUF2851 family protein n=1 Tax=Reichenbachiella ulvae TaxID=2980104 RepID=A0ABT3CWH7_9BACT|nr:DUF2851 family protein [Reichenbachiella ulvae]MCV9387959.1 DUF2851 family protein [Reichenbachiella ulvae]
MQESFLHFVWKHQKFDKTNLQTTTGSSVSIHSIGHHNHDAGPDFLESQLMIGEVKWFGSVEIHVNASDWKNHNHHLDPKYNTVILHVVWNADSECRREDGESIPTLELKKLISLDLIIRCNDLVNFPSSIPCEKRFAEVRSIDKMAMLDHAAVARLKRKSEELLSLHSDNTGSWEETSYQLIAKTFGFKKNAEPMLKLAQSLPFKILIKHGSKREELEALLFGMAGFLEGESMDTYHGQLKEIYSYLRQKYNLEPKQMIKVEWKFLRMRPANFPTVRLAQLAQLIHLNSKFFQFILQSENTGELKKIFQITNPEYWVNHYDFGKESSRKMNGLGEASVDVLLVNVAAVLLAAYAQETASLSYMDKAVDLLQSLKPEKNHIISDWEALGMEPENAFDTQALIELKNEFCLKKKCLSCKIGLKLISG